MARQLIDGTAAAAAVTAPWWLTAMEQGAAALVAIGGGVLIVLRIWIACFEIADWIRKRRERAAEGGI